MKLLKPTKPGMRQQREEIVRKWEESGLLDNMSLMPGKINIAELMQSEAMTLLNLETFSLEENKRFEEYVTDAIKCGDEQDFTFYQSKIINTIVKKIKKKHCE